MLIQKGALIPHFMNTAKGGKKRAKTTATIFSESILVFLIRTKEGGGRGLGVFFVNSYLAKCRVVIT